MNVERAVLWHIPHHLRQHPEGHYYLEVGLVRPQLIDEGRILHLLRLKHREIMLQGEFLYF